MDKPTPRVDSGMLREHIGVTVRFVAKVVQLQPPNGALVEGADHGKVTVHLTPDCTLGSRYVEIIGRVEPDGTLQEFSTTNLGDDFDMELYAKALALTQKYPQLFG